MRTVFQSYALFPHMTVQGNVAFPLQMAKVHARRRLARKIDEALAGVRLAGFNSAFRTSSPAGSASAWRSRALVTHPRAVASTRQLAALDAKLREEMQLEPIRDAEGGRDHVRLRDARPDRGARAVASHRGDEPRPRRGRRARQALRVAAHALRRRFHRHLQPARRAGRARRRRTVAIDVADLAPSTSPVPPPPDGAATARVALRPEKVGIAAPARRARARTASRAP